MINFFFFLSLKVRSDTPILQSLFLVKQQNVHVHSPAYSSSQGHSALRPMPTKEHQSKHPTSHFMTAWPSHSYGPQCDRNLPVCNNCNEEADGPACNYTPKRRSRMQDPASGALNDAKSKPWLKIAAKAESTGHTFYGHNIASSRTKSNSPDGSETISDLDTATHTGRFSADIARPSRVPATDYLHFGAIPARPAPPSVEFIPHPFSSNQQVVVNAAHINPWPHLNLAPLPSFMLRCLHQVDGIEMPKRADFDNQLATFIQGLMEELRETACIPGDTYARVCQALAAGNLSTISERLKMWVNTHHVTLGSDQMDILLLPHETLYSLPATESPPYKRRVVADLLDPNKDEVAMKVCHGMHP